jgi:hypothetical protein
VCKKLPATSAFFDRVKRKDTILIKLGRIFDLKRENERSHFGKIKEKPEIEAYFSLYFPEKKKYSYLMINQAEGNSP